MVYLTNRCQKSSSVHSVMIIIYKNLYSMGKVGSQYNAFLFVSAGKMFKSVPGKLIKEVRIWILFSVLFSLLRHNEITIYLRFTSPSCWLSLGQAQHGGGKTQRPKKKVIFYQNFT